MKRCLGGRGYRREPTMSAAAYERIGKAAILRAPEHYSWKCVLAFVQFTHEELLNPAIRPHLDMHSLIRYQKCVTRAFLQAHFTTEIAADPDVDWNTVETYVHE
jgi:hypothetical protein